MNLNLKTEPSQTLLDQILKLYKEEKFDLAKNKINESIKIHPESHLLHNILGGILAHQDKLDEAIDCHKKAINLKPNYAEAYNNLGLIFYKKNFFNESVENYKKAIALKPDLNVAFFNIGNVYKEQKKFKDAIIYYNKAIELNPNFPEAHKNLGDVFYVQGNFKEAIICYKKSLQYKPNFSSALNNYANTLRDLDQINEAIFNYEKAIEHEPTNAVTYNNLGNLLIEIGKVQEAKECYSKAFKIDPKNIQFEINKLLSMPPMISSLDDLNYNRKSYQNGLKNLTQYQLHVEEPFKYTRLNSFFLSYQAKNNLDIFKNTASTFKKIFPNINYTSQNIHGTNNSKIKIGFISEFFTQHTIGKLFGGLIKNLNKKLFDVTIFHLPLTKKSLIKEQIDKTANKVVNLEYKISDQHKQIEKEKLDIIFYPDIGMSNSTYFLAFSKLAPVQIVSWGHPDTTGIDTIDYFLSSVLFENSITQKKYSENLILLNSFPLYYEPTSNYKNLKDRKNLGLPENANLYICPQSLFKLHPDFDEILEKILIEDKNANLIFIGGFGKYKFWTDTLKKRWSKKNSKLIKKTIFLNRLNFIEYLSLCNCADVLLDPIYFGGGNSFLEAMLFGTPTITMPDEYLKSNITAAAYKQMKISNPPIVKDSQNYIYLACELANNKKLNQDLREQSKIAAEKFLFKNNQSLKEYEKFFIEAHKAMKLGNKLKNGYIVK